MNLTTQQNEIIEAIPKYKNIKINAFAGTGKTTTLKLIANKFREKNILYLAFNSSIKSEASKIFPSNTHVKTTHGLAFLAIKKYTNINLDLLVNYRAIDISKEFELTYNQAITSLKIFENFCNNKHDTIEKDDLEHKTAKKMFDNMLLSLMKPTHSFYLKYYYLLLKREEIPQYQYDILMLDEAQDTNEVTLGIFERLKAKTKIFVGDRHQQVYSFRGSKNAIEKIVCNKEFYLSTSFRFNNSIANYANILLKNFKNEDVQINGIIDEDNEEIKTNAFISRTNASLISIIANRIETRKPFVTIRDPNEIFNLTIEVYYFLINDLDEIKRNKFLKDFNSEDDLSDYAKEVEDFELKSAIKVAREYKEKIFEFKDIATKFFKAWNNRELNGFEKRLDEILFLTTAHTSKGLEWDRVIVGDDFNDFADLILDMGCTSLEEFQKKLNQISNQELLDEFNLFYVAITRAKKSLVKDSENFHYLMSKNINKLVDARIKELDESINENVAVKKVNFSKMEKIDKEKLRQDKNLKDGKAKNSGLKWNLEEKIKVKSMYKKNESILDIAKKLDRSTSSILGELLKSEIISKDEQIELSNIIKKGETAKKSCL